MLRCAQYWFRTADGAVRIDKFGGGKILTALLTLVAVCVGISAVGTLTFNIAVGQESLCLLVEVLFAFLLDKFSFFVELFKEFGRGLCVYVRSSTAINTKAYSEFLKRFFDEFMVAVADILRSDALFLSADGDRYSVFVGTTDKENITSAKAQIAHIDVGRHINSRQVSDMNTTVGIGQSGRHKGALEVFLFHIISFSYYNSIYVCKITSI